MLSVRDERTSRVYTREIQHFAKITQLQENNAIFLEILYFCENFQGHFQKRNKRRYLRVKRLGKKIVRKYVNINNEGTTFLNNILIPNIPNRFPF